MKCEVRNANKKNKGVSTKRQGKRNYHRQVVKEGPPTKEQLNNHARGTRGRRPPGRGSSEWKVCVWRTLCSPTEPGTGGGLA